jgi:hypothetical protein
MDFVGQMAMHWPHFMQNLSLSWRKVIPPRGFFDKILFGQTSLHNAQALQVC